MQLETGLHTSFINSQSVLEVSGEDAVKFFQGQCSADVEKLKTGETVPGCICTVKGRVITSFTCTKTKDSLLLKMTAELVQPTIDYLGKYAAFFKVELIGWTHPCVVSSSQPLEDDDFIQAEYTLGKGEFHDALIPESKLDAVLEKITAQNYVLTPEEDWQQAQIRAGWLNLNSMTSEKYLPHQLNLDQLGAISFTKGCYTGQEIIARTEYRGKPKRRIHILELENFDSGSLELPAELIDAESEKAAGELIAVAGNHALALISIDTPARGSFLLGRTEISYELANQPFTD